MSDETVWDGTYRRSAKDLRWRYTKVGVTGRWLPRKRSCRKCGEPHNELFKRYVDGGEAYGPTHWSGSPLYVEDKFAYCHTCITAMWMMDDLDDLVTGGKDDPNE
jgi:hypothetical protein